MGRVRVVRASAGSGKTYRLSYEYVKRVMTNPELYRGILAVTFTNKATEEMKRRIVREINDLANGCDATGRPPAFLEALRSELRLSTDEVRGRAGIIRTKILHDYSRFTVLTIDKFFQRIIRAFLRELGVDSDYTLELQTDSVLSGAADRLIEDTLENRELREWIARFVEEQIEDGKRWDVKGEITGLGYELFKEQYKNIPVVAGGRETLRQVMSEVTARRKKCEHTLIRLATEALRVMDENGLEAGDFYGGKNGLVSYFYKIASGDITSGYGQRVKDALASEEKWCAKTSERKEAVRAVVPKLKPLLEEICALHDRNIRFIHTADLLRENYRTCAMLGDLAGYVTEACEARNLMLISETNHIIGRLIGDNEMPFIFEKMGNVFSHFMIDEFQDTSKSQWNNFYPLVNNALAQSPGAPVLIVGDVKQSIYRWRGGDWEILGRELNEQFPEVEEVTLDRNYRSRGVVVEFNNHLISEVVRTDNAELNGKVGEACEEGCIDAALRNRLQDMLARAYRRSEQKLGREKEAGKGVVRLTRYEPDGEEEPEKKYIIGLIDQLQERGFRPRDIAVLVRYNAEAVRVANMLLEHKSAHPESKYRYDVVTQQALVIGTFPVVRFLIACFRLAVNIHDPISRAFYKKWLGKGVGEELSESETNFIRSLRLVSLEEAFENLVMEYGLDADPGHIAYLQAFHEQLLGFAGARISDIPLFLKWWDETGAAESVNLPGGQDAVTIITVHKAKGLQYPVVILPYADWEMAPKSGTLLWADAKEAPFAELGRMPVRYKTAVADSCFAPYYYRELVYTHVDNINTLYVAVTRAEEELYLMMPRRRSDGTKISQLIGKAFEERDGTVVLGGLTGRLVREDGCTVYEFGTPCRKHAAETDAGESLLPASSYPTYPFSGKLRFKASTVRYVSEDGSPAVSPRHYGRIMHRVFEAVTSAGQIEPVLNRFVFEGLISSEDYEKVRGHISEAFRNPLIASWFDGSWEVVRNEHDIVVPSKRRKIVFRRPDRVLVRQKEAVVIDYKFGRQESETYRRQVRNYMRLIRKMGYPDVSGYLWYVENGEVVPVEL